MKIYCHDQSARAISITDLDFDKRREEKEEKEEKEGKEEKEKEKKLGNSKPRHFPEEMAEAKRKS